MTVKNIFKEYDRLIATVLAGAMVGIFALGYHYHQVKVKAARVATSERADINTIQNPEPQTTTSHNSAEVDCSSYRDPDTPGPFTTSDLAGQIPTSNNASCQLKCSLDKLGLLGYQSKGLVVTHQIYDDVYVAQVQKDKCGTPLPYCVFNTTVACPVTSSATPNAVPAEGESGYDAGYSYAEQYQICDPTYDNGKSQEFNDGVHAWTADHCN